MTADDREIGRLQAEAEACLRGERDLWDAKQLHDAEISKLEKRLTVLETEKAFAGIVAKAIWTVIGGAVMWFAQHFGFPTPRP